MWNPLLSSYASLRFLLFLTLPHLLLARVAIDPLPQQTLYNTFKLYLGGGPGGCNRNAPNGAQMMQHVLDSLGGAWAVSQTVAQDLPSYPTQTYIRGLLFLFFGITFQANHQINSNTENVNAYNNIKANFDAVNRLFADPGTNKYNTKPRYRCLEDYASYFTQLPDANGQMNTSAPLVGEYFDQIVPGGYKIPGTNNIWPGLMWVYNSLDGTRAWYPPNPTNPPLGYCGNPAFEVVAFASVGFDGRPLEMQALYGITMCKSHFEQPLLLDLGMPGQAASIDEIKKFLTSSDIIDLHEAFHLISDGVIIDTPSVVPPDGTNGSAWTTNRDFASWTLDDVHHAYGYYRTVFLGLARPQLARINADSWSNFAGCMYFPELDCLGAFQNDIRARKVGGKMPFGVKLRSRAMKRIREGKFDLRRDLPMDLDLEGGVEERKNGDLKRGVERKGESRFRDGVMHESLFG